MFVGEFGRRFSYLTSFSGEVDEDRFKVVSYLILRVEFVGFEEQMSF